MDKVLINGQEFSWAQIKININGQQLIGVTAITYTENEEMQENFGAGSRPISRSYGQITAEGSVTFIMSELVRLQDAAPNKRIQDIPEFDAVVAYIPRDGVGRTIVDTLHNCRFKTNGRSSTRGDMEIAQEVPMMISHITFG